MSQKNNTYYLYFKYPTHAWLEYDRTRDMAWAKIQKDRMLQEHPGADYKVEMNHKEIKLK